MNNSRKKQVAIAFVSILVLVGVSVGVRILIRNVFSPSKEEQVSQFVEKSKQNLHVPTQVDKITTLSDIKAEGDDAAVFEYKISGGVKPSDISKAELQKSASANICDDEGSREALDADVALKSHYTFADSSETIDFTTTKNDCSS